MQIVMKEHAKPEQEIILVEKGNSIDIGNTTYEFEEGGTVKVQERYQGWENYNTWNITSWINMDKDLYRQVMSVLNDSGNIQDAAKQLKNFFYSDINRQFQRKDCYVSDIMKNVMSEINWFEVVDSLLKSDSY